MSDLVLGLAIFAAAIVAAVLVGKWRARWKLWRSVSDGHG